MNIQHSAINVIARWLLLTETMPISGCDSCGHPPTAHVHHGLAFGRGTLQVLGDANSRNSNVG